MILLPLVLACVASAQEAPAPVFVPSPRPAVEGHFPEGAFMDRSERLAGIWEFVKVLGGAPAGLTPPVIHFDAFDPAEQDTAWTEWQLAWDEGKEQIWTDYLCNPAGLKKQPEVKTLCGDQPKMNAWIASHPEIKKEFPFPKQFRAFHYDGTDRIQIDPGTTFMSFYQNGPQGFKVDMVGYGYHVAGHEMLHYVLENAGIPPLTHHCLFVTPQADGKSYMEKLDDFLIAKGWGGNALSFRYGAPAEASLNPCGR